jgi:hypothetical protein
MVIGKHYLYLLIICFGQLHFHNDSAYSIKNKIKYKSY